MRNLEQGCDDRCGWHGIAADIGIVAIAAITLTMAARSREEPTIKQNDDYTAWQASYHITPANPAPQSTQAIWSVQQAPMPVPTGWSNETRPDVKPALDLQWDCELIETPRNDSPHLLLVIPQINQNGFVPACGHQVDRGRRPMDAAK